MLNSFVSYSRKLPHYIIGKYKQFKAVKLLKKSSLDIASISNKGVIIICNATSNTLPSTSFFQYYKLLGIENFIVLSNESSKQMHTIIAEDFVNKVNILQIYIGTKNGTNHYISGLINHFFKDRWCLICEPTEYIAYPKMSDRKLEDFCEFMESERRRHVFGVEIDLYRAAYRNISQYNEKKLQDFCDPLKGSWKFDISGYLQNWNNKFHSIEFLGGYKNRSSSLINNHNDKNRSKICLIRSNGDYDFLSNMRFMFRASHNSANSDWHLSPTICLLSTSHFVNICANFEKIDRKKRNELSMSLVHENTRDIDLQNSSALEEYDLLNKGQWF